ncbi:glycosyltransferase family 92 protein [Rhodoblastus sp.]|uniref:glycosyltransferase family 92 protein n=1 Tax=Rhodoblastus sp. TaxID=1962975 RepID=UPI003F97E243
MVTAETPRFRYSLAACARWEDDDIVEWIEYHKLIGIDHIYLYCNDDTPETLLKRVLPYLARQDPFVTFVHWTETGAQLPMYKDYLDNYKGETEWCCFLDIDEFIVLKQYDNIASFMTRFDRSVDCVYFNWILFGNNGRKQRDGSFTLSALTRRSKRIDIHTKSFFRTAKVTAESAMEGARRTGLAFTHFWNNYYAEGAFNICNVLGEDMRDYTEQFPQNALNIVTAEGWPERIVQTGYVAHFQFKSEQDFIRRVERGGFAAQQLWKDLYDRGEAPAYLNMINEVEDTYLADLWTQHLAKKLRIGP